MHFRMSKSSSLVFGPVFGSYYPERQKKNLLCKVDFDNGHVILTFHINFLILFMFCVVVSLRKIGPPLSFIQFIISTFRLGEEGVKEDAGAFWH